MITKLTAAAVFALAICGVAAPSLAEDFPATPIQSGPPRNLPGETLIPGMQEAVDVVNGVTQPILQPILVPAGDAIAPGVPAPLKRHRHRIASRGTHHHHHLAALAHHKKVS